MGSEAAQYCSWSGEGPSGKQLPSVLYCCTSGAGHSGSQQQLGVHDPKDALHTQVPDTLLLLDPVVVGTVVQSMLYLLKLS
jgi:hypothetical protein